LVVSDIEAAHDEFVGRGAIVLRQKWSRSAAPIEADDVE
jgi:hypothetical protein